MKTIKAIVFGALVLVASASGLLMLMLLLASDVSSLLEYIKWLAVDALVLWASVTALQYLKERWYRQ